MSSDLAALRGVIVSIHSRDPACLALVIELAKGVSTYPALMRSVEDSLRASKEDKPLTDIGQRVVNQTARKLYDLVVQSAPLLKIFQTDPRLSESPARLVDTVARLADIRPAPDGIFATSDRAFMRILEPVSRGLAVSADKLLQDDFERMVALNGRFPDMMVPLEALANAPTWPADLLRVEQHLEDPASAGDVEALAEPARTLIKFIEDCADPADRDGPRAMLLASPRFSAMLPEELSAFCAVRGKLPSVEEVLSKEIYHSAASDAERDRALARKAIELIAADHRDLIQHCLDVRIRTAREYLDLRSFVKIDALESRWPELSSYLRHDRSAMLNLEAEIVWGAQPAGPRPASSPLSGYAQDRRFQRFMLLRPLLKDIYPGEMQARLPLAPPEATIPGPVPQATDLTTAAAAQKSGVLPKPSFVQKEAPVAYDTITVKIDTDGPQHKVAVNAGKSEAFEHLTTLPISEIRDLVQQIRSGREYVTTARALRELTSRGASNVTETIREVGDKLFDALFPNKTREKALDLLRTERTLRILFEVSDPRLAFFPWEALYVEELLAFPALTNCWIQRLMRPEVPRTTVGFELPLRILAVMSNPSDTAPLNVEGEREMLQMALAQAVNANLVRLQVIGPDESTLQNVLRQVRTFRPHVFHFVGHGLYDGDQGTIVLGDRSKGVIVPASDVITMLDGYGIVLAVLNSCDTGNSLTNDAVTSLAGTLVRRGLPAVVATMREVADDTALMFTRDFYSAVVAGEPVETAITESRKALSLEKWDWSVYALFTSLKKLDKLRLPVPLRQAEMERR